MPTTSKIKFKQISQFLLSISLLFNVIQCLDTCTNLQSTLYDGYIDSNINYANFNSIDNSSFKFPNPFYGNQNLMQATFAFWAKFPQDPSLIIQQGTFLDCLDTVNINIQNGSLQFNITQGAISSTAIPMIGSLNSASQSLTSLSQWTHFAFSFSGSTQYIFINGTQVSSAIQTFSSLSTQSQYCTLGLSQNLSIQQQSLTMQMRHFYISKVGWTIKTVNITNVMHNVISANDPSMMTYFKFDKSFSNQQSYFFSPNAQNQYTSTGMSIQSSLEPEFVCQCTGTYPNYLLINNQVQLNPFNLTVLSPSASISTTGFTLEFQLYAMFPQNTDPLLQNDVLLYQLDGYAQIYLVNSSTSLKLILYPSSSTAQPITFNFTSYQFRYNQWTVIAFTVSKTQVTLNVDNTVNQVFPYTLALPASAKLLTIVSPVSTFQYALGYVSIKNAATVLWNQTFSQNLLSDPKNQTLVKNGTMQFYISNYKCSPSETNSQTYWTGFGCQDRRLYSYFSGNISQGYIQSSQLFSSQSTMTIQLWIKDFNMGNSQTQVIFENSINGKDPLIQIGIITNTSLSLNRSIYCIPNIPQNGTLYNLSGQTTYNNWIHFSCISDISNQQSRSQLYKPQTNQVIDTYLPNVMFQSVQSNIITTIGSRVDGSQKFVGFMRDLKIWQIALTDSQIQLYRYQSLQSLQTDLLYYFSLSNQINPLSVQGRTQDITFVEQNLQSPLIQWNLEKDLIICQEGLYYNGQCCGYFNISTANFLFTQPTSNVLSLTIDPLSISNSVLYYSLKANYTIQAIGNNFNYTPQVWAYSNQSSQNSYPYIQYLQQYFNVNQTQSYNVSSQLVNPSIYNITMSAQIYSDYQPSVIIYKTQTLKLTCPMLWLNILPNQYIDQQQIVSLNSLDNNTIIYASYQLQCYNPTIQRTVQNSLSSIAWISNQIITFSTLFNLTQSNTQCYAIAGNKQKYISVGSPVNVTATLSYNTSQKVSSSINMNFQNLYINTGYSSSSINALTNYGGTILLDFSKASASANPLINIIQYQVQCPYSMFYNQSQYNSLCSISTNGIFSLDTSQIQIVANYPYTFIISMIIQGSSIMEQIVVTEMFVKDGTSAILPCPRIEFPVTNDQSGNYTYDIITQPIVQIIPDPYLSCSLITYNVNAINWTVTDLISGQPINNILQFGSQTLYRFANITSLAIPYIKSGQILNITIIYNSTQTSGSKQTVISYNSTYITFTQTPLQVNILALNSNKTQFQINNTVPYTEENLILDASTSIDPNNKTAILAFQWICPDIISIDLCSTFQRGVNNQSLYINALQRVKINFQFNTSYNFQVTAYEPSNPYKTPVSQNITIYFNAPTQYDSNNNYDMYPTCDLLSISSTVISYYNQTYQNTLRFDINNYTQSVFQSQSSQKSTCTYGQIQDQLLLIYVFNTNIFNITTPPLLLYEQNITTGIQTQQSQSVNMSSLFNLLNVSYYGMYQVTIYQYTQRNSSLDQIYLNINSFYLYRQSAMLIPSLVNSSIQVDKYNNLIINASTSYDPEQSGINCTYIWTCPSSLNCISQTSSILNISSTDRIKANVDTNNQNYTYSVKMTDGIRISNSVQAQVQITQSNSYSTCTSVNIITDNLNSFDQNTQTLYIQYSQQYPINIQMQVQTNCQSVTLNKPLLSSIPTTSFWTFDSTNNKILISSINISKLSPQVQYSMMFSQPFYMSIDSSNLMYVNYTINVIISQPDLVTIITGPKIAQFDSSNTQIILDGSQSYDPVSTNPITYSWNCPLYFGGNSCSMTKQKILDSQTLNASLPSGDNINQYFNMAHQFTLIITSADQKRTGSQTYFLYLSDSTQGPFASQPGISQCGIYLQNNQGQQILSFQQQLTFNLSCPSNQTFAQSLLSTDTILTWKINGLIQNVDYFQANNILYLNPYAADRLQSQQIQISTYISQGDSSKIMINPLIWAFTTSTNQLSYDTNSQVIIPFSTQIAYTQQYNFTILNIFSSLQKYGINVQLRSQTNNIDSIVIPYMQVNNDTMNKLYTNRTLPLSSSLYLDFFDMNQSYLNSYSFLSKQFQTNVLGKYQQSDFELILYQICANQNYSDYITYLSDIIVIQQLSEAINLNIITPTQDSSLNTLNYTQTIINYITTTGLTVLNQYLNGTLSIYQQEAKMSLERKIILTLSNIAITKNTYPNQIDQILSIIEQIKSNYTFITSEGSDQTIIKQSIIQSIQMANNSIQILTQLIQSNNTNFTMNQVNSYQNRVNILQQWIIGGNLIGVKTGQIVTTISSNSNIQSILLDNSTQSQTYITFKSQINPNESVILPDQSQLSQSYGVTSMQISYMLSTNTSSPASTILQINAYDQNYSIIDINTNQILKQQTIFSMILKQVKQSQQRQLTTQSQQILSFQLQTNDQYKQLFNQTRYDNTSKTFKYPVCVYYDLISQQWSSSGLVNNSYDYSTGILNCSTTHLSQFTIDSIDLVKPVIDIPPNNQSVTDNYYFTNTSHVMQYYVSIGIATFITLLTILISCKQFTVWDSNPPTLGTMKQKKYSCCAVCKATCILHHIIISAFCGPNKSSIHLTLPKVNKMIDMWWLLFAIFGGFGVALWQLPDIVWTYVRIIEVSAFIIGCIVIVRIFVLTIGYSIYFSGQKDYSTLENDKDLNSYNNSAEKSQNYSGSKSYAINDTILNSGSDLEEGMLNKPLKKKGKKKKKKRSKQIREQHNFDMEGGSSEDEQNNQVSQRQRRMPNNDARTAASKSKDKQLSSPDAGIRKGKKKGIKHRSKRYDDGTNSKQGISSSNEKQDINIELNRQQINDNVIKASKTSNSVQKNLKTKKYERSNEESKQDIKIQGGLIDQISQIDKSSNRMSKMSGFESQQLVQESKSNKRDQRSKSPLTGNMNQMGEDKQDLFVEDNYTNSRIKSMSSYNDQFGQNSDLNNDKKRKVKKSKQHSSQFSNKEFTPNEMSLASNILKSKQFQDDQTDEEIKQQLQSDDKPIKKLKKKKRSSPSPQRLQSGVNSGYENNSRINQSVFSNTLDNNSIDKSVRSTYYNQLTDSNTKKQSIISDEDENQYRTKNWVTRAIKLLLLFSCMVLTFWMMRYFYNIEHIYVWLVVTGISYFVFALILQPIFILLFALFFMCTSGNGCCGKTSQILLLGNGHRNVINGILYHLNNN